MNKTLNRRRRQSLEAITAYKQEAQLMLTTLWTRPTLRRPSICEASQQNCGRIFEFFHETRGSLNFVTVDSCSQNLSLISCMYA